MHNTHTKKTALNLVDIYLCKLKQMTPRQLSRLLAGNPQQAAVWVRVAAMQGLPEAQLRLARMLLEGTGVAKDQTKAFVWFQRAAQSCDADALNMLGRCFENGWGVPVNAASAVDYYRRAAQAGHDWAQYNLGHCYLDGHGIARDPGLAFFWYRQAAKQGHARAINLLGRCYEEGWGVAQDAQAARQCYRKSAEGGYFRGQYNWATLLADEGHLDSAGEWFLLAADNGSQAVRRAVACTLLESKHPYFHALGLSVLARCCQHGEAIDFYRYGRALLLGINGNPDHQQAAYWLRRAEQGGYKPKLAAKAAPDEPALQEPAFAKPPKPSSVHNLTRHC